MVQNTLDMNDFSSKMQQLPCAMAGSSSDTLQIPCKYHTKRGFDGFGIFCWSQYMSIVFFLDPLTLRCQVVRPDGLHAETLRGWVGFWDLGPFRHQYLSTGDIWAILSLRIFVLFYWEKPSDKPLDDFRQTHFWTGWTTLRWDKRDGDDARWCKGTRLSASIMFETVDGVAAWILQTKNEAFAPEFHKRQWWSGTQGTYSNKTPSKSIK